MFSQYSVLLRQKVKASCLYSLYMGICWVWKKFKCVLNSTNNQSLPSKKALMGFLLFSSLLARSRDPGAGILGVELWVWDFLAILSLIVCLLSGTQCTHLQNGHPHHIYWVSVRIKWAITNKGFVLKLGTGWLLHIRPLCGGLVLSDLWLPSITLFTSPVLLLPHMFLMLFLVTVASLPSASHPLSFLLCAASLFWEPIGIYWSGLTHTGYTLLRELVF